MVHWFASVERHRGARAMVFLAACVAGCSQPSDVLHDPPPYAPVSTEYGWQLTSGPDREVVRGFVGSRVLFRARGLVGFVPDEIIATVDTVGGAAREEVAVYRQAFLQPVGTVEYARAHRVIAVWKAPQKGDDGCPAANGVTPPDAAPVVHLTLYALGEEDGAAIATLPRLEVNVDAVAGASTSSQRVRITPALREIRDRGTNPLGPASLPDGSFVFSDGERLYHGRAGDTVAATLIGNGAFPAVSGDGSLVAYAVPMGLDSVVQIYVVPLGLGSCVQEHVEIFEAGWHVMLRDLASGSETDLGVGVEPVFDPVAPRILVRDGDTLQWRAYDGTDLGTLGAPLGAFAAALSADGAVAAYSHAGAGSVDVYIRPVPR